MAIYTDIIKTLGQELVDYNVSGWALFRDQMALEISSQYVLGNERRPDESLLTYSRESIEKSLKSVKDGANNFTYYTSSGPESKIDSSIGDAQLADPRRKLKRSDTNIKVDAGNYRDANGQIIEEFYEEGSVKKLENLMRPKEKPLTLLEKTNKWFAESGADYLSGKFTTLISRFHTDKNQLPISELQKSVGLQGFSTTYGLSRGNSVLKADAKDGEKGADYNPYCRVWTWHQAYKNYKDTMRPFRVGDEEKLEEDYNWKVFRSNNNLLKSKKGTKLREYGVMYDNNGNTNGLVNITPSTKDGETKFDVSVKKCMFSIENLAWKGTYNSWNTSESNGLSQEQKGPLGGRIMWFPPYDLKFNETTTANWQTNDFIGRGEPIFTYANTVRSGTLSFKLLIDHPAILDYWEKRDKESEPNSGIDDVSSKEQELLRFFAGCSVLTAKGPKEEKVEEESKTETDSAATPVGPRLVFDVYFPNNYSGKDDRNTDINPIDYLINGVATNRGRLTTSNDGKIEDISTDITTIWKDGTGQQVGGYEIRGLGISLVHDAPPTEVIADVTSSDGNSYTLIAIKNKNGKPKYCYRVDSGLNEVLVRSNSYVNIASASLNSRTIPTDLKDKDATTVTFTDFYVALKPEAKDVLRGYFTQDRVAICEKILKQSKITSVQCLGEASYQGKDKNNQGLAERRAETVKEWLKDKISFEGEIKTSSKTHKTDNSTSPYADADTNKARIQRKVRVTIYYEDSSTEDASQTQMPVPESGTLGTTSAVLSDKGEKGTNVQGNTPPEQPVDIPYNNIALGRYDNEARFFKRLTKEDPFVTRLISERIKNFDPVFHSMSPEGFNARLTFLNQCLRQGPTLSGVNSDYANNLAFGVPPVCVLRVGDFYNTKIIITNLNINYDPLSWDLNEEGIGVMPMIANIDISFNFIGGSDLGGPIQRLQNATSFNYYANASVYDNRAEEIIYENGKFTAFKAFEPNMYKE